jgi:hypothetical protein
MCLEAQARLRCLLGADEYDEIAVAAFVRHGGGVVSVDHLGRI